MPEKPSLLDAIAAKILIANGAMGTMLAAAGLKLSNSARANLEYPDTVRDVFSQYAAAGATVFQSNTFVANEVMLRHAGLEEQHDEINRAGLRLVREAVGQSAYVAANLGPTGEMLRPLGTATPESVAAVFERQARVLLSEQPDFVLLESFEALDELEAAIAGVRAAELHVPLAVTFSFSQPSGRSMMGIAPRQAAETIAGLGADIIGANCGLPETTVAAIEEMAQVTDRPLMIQANAGLPELREGQACFSGTPEQSALLALRAAACGARIIGGCCGTGPAHVRAMYEAIAARA